VCFDIIEKCTLSAPVSDQFVCKFPNPEQSKQMPRDFVTHVARSKKNRIGILIPGISTNNPTSANFGRIRRFWLYLLEEYIDAEPELMSQYELEAKARFPLPLKLSLSVNQQGVPNLVQVDEWPQLGLALKWDQHQDSHQHTLSIHIEDNTKHVAKLLSTAVGHISAVRTGFAQKRKLREQLENKLRLTIEGMRQELEDAGVAAVFLPQLFGQEDLIPDTNIPSSVSEGGSAKLFRSGVAPSRQIYVVK
jgi:hypothetical protein